MSRYTLLFLTSLGLTGCVQPTSFKGEPKFPDGVAGCKQACTNEGLEFGGFVFSGEFATSCVCQAVRGPAPVSSIESSAESSPTAGVVVQTQAAAAAAAASSRELARRQQMQDESQHRQQQQYHH
jgi:hypothetical protein